MLNYYAHYPLSLSLAKRTQPANATTQAKKRRLSGSPSAKLAGIIPGENVDIVAIVLDQGSLTKTKGGITRRSVVLGDASERKVELILWRERAKNWNLQKGSIIAVKGARACLYNCIYQLATTYNTRIELAPSTDESTQLLQKWWMEKGKRSDFKPVYHIIALENALEELGKLREGRCHFIIKCSMKIADEKISYPSCPDCYKKTYQSDGS